MSSTAKIDSTGVVTQLGSRQSPDENVTADDAADSSKLARLLGRVLRELAAINRRFEPDRIDFEDVAVSTGGAAVTLRHNFTGRVRWYLVGWQSSGTAAPILKEDTTNVDMRSLVLLSYVAGTATIRVETAG